MSEPYRFLNTHVQNAAMNMAIDESILTHHLKDEVPPTLRVFRWSQPSISVGRFQSIEREILSEVCLKHGVAVVRRPTGGRAVYHLDEFTYSIVMSKYDGVPSGVVAAYTFLAQGLLAALKLLGVQAELSDERVSKHSSAACFASSTQADLTSGGFKLIGSAQVWKDNTLLQQGSLPLDDRSAEFFTMLRFPNKAVMNEALAMYREKTTPLHTFAPYVTWDVVADAFISGFSSALQVDFVHDTLSLSEWELANQLVEEKYSKPEWRKKHRISLAESL